MAAVTFRDSDPDTANVAQYVSNAFVPADGELLVAFALAGGTLAAGAMTDTQALGFTRVQTALWNTSTSTLYAFVADAFAAAVSMTVTFDCTGDPATGCIIFVVGVSGMLRTGAQAIRQDAREQNTTGVSTPTAVFGSVCLTANPTMAAVANRQSPATITEPLNWLELADTGYITPASGGELVARDSGFTGNTFAWQSTYAAGQGAMIALELDTSAAPPPGAESTIKLRRRRLAPVASLRVR